MKQTEIKKLLQEATNECTDERRREIKKKMLMGITHNCGSSVLRILAEQLFDESAEHNPQMIIALFPFRK